MHRGMLTASQCRMARAALRWTVPDLAARARVNRNTINSFELGRTAPNPATLTVIRQAFEAAGVVFSARGVELQEREDA
jgi:transcriptional regulator with XRE-family HTH domain